MAEALGGAGVAGPLQLAALADLRRHRFGEAAALAVVIDVVVFVGVPADQGLAGGEEDVAAVGGGVDQVARIFALAGGDQVVAAVGGRIVGAALGGAAAGSGALELIDVELFVFVFLQQRIEGFEEEAIAVVGEVAGAFEGVAPGWQRCRALGPRARGVAGGAVEGVGFSVVEEALGAERAAEEIFFTFFWYLQCWPSAIVLS